MSPGRQADWLLVNEALERILAAVAPLGTEEVDLLSAGGRTLGVSVTSPVDQPPWTNSAMDGYAVRSADVSGASEDAPRTVRVIESVAAGAFPTRVVGEGEATRVMTGAPLPEGADGVIRVEHTRAAGEARVAVVNDMDAGRNVRRRGEDLERGQVVLEAGSVLRAGEVGVLATVGVRRVPVFRRARIGILATGNELADLEQFDEVLAGRRIINSNSWALAAGGAGGGQ